MASQVRWRQYERGRWWYYVDGECKGTIERRETGYFWQAAGTEGTRKHYEEAQTAIRKAIREQAE